MATKRNLALKRITNEIKELSECPLEGMGIASLDDDPMKFIVNMELMMGPYQGYKVQLKMNLSEEYPIKPPQILLYPNQEISNLYHQHIYQDKQGFKKFCFNPVNNDLTLDASKKYMGWNPAYTISGILLQVQNFLSDPDLPEEKQPSKEKIAFLMKSMENYKKAFFIQDKNGQKEILHTWKDPYPKMYYQKENKNQINEKEDKKTIMMKQSLTCSLLKETYLKNPDLLLGYPIIQVKINNEKEKINLFPIPQLVSYEAYKIMDQNKAMVLINEHYLNAEKFQEKNNQYFIRWFPIYLNENHFNKSQQKMMECSKEIKDEKEFKSEQIFEILTMIIKRLIIGMLKGKAIISSEFIMCYFQFFFLFKMICKEFQESFERYLHHKTILLEMKDYNTSDELVPNISDFLIWFSMGIESLSSEKMKIIKESLLQEFIAHQIGWIFHGPENAKIKEKVVEEMWIDDEIFFNMFENNPSFQMEYHHKFNDNLHKWGLYQEIIKIISSDYDYLYQYYNDKVSAKNMAKEKIKYDFKELFNECGKWGKSKLRTFILKNMHFKNYFNVDEEELKDQLYEECKVDQIMKKNPSKVNEIIRKAFNSQKANHLLIITFFSLRRMKEKNLFEEQEKSYDIYNKIEEIMKELRQKLKEVQSYKALCECLDTDLGKGKNEMDIIAEAYQRAKNKGYIEGGAKKAH